MRKVHPGPISNTLVLHDFAVAVPDVKGWFDSTIEFFLPYKLEFERIGVTTKDQRPKKTKTFKRGKADVDKFTAEEIHSVEFYGNFIESPDKSTDYTFKAQLDIDPSEKTTMVVCVDAAVVPFAQEIMIALFKRYNALLGARYGYGFLREFKKGPSWYPFGVLQNIDDKRERALITQWGDLYTPEGRYRTGDLRDIYPYNLVCKAHLDREVGGESLRTWIEKDSTRGELIPVGENRWIWQIEESFLHQVRQDLLLTGIILCK